MGNLLGGGGDGGAGAARIQENRRQGLANAGVNYVNSIFEGGSAPLYTAVAPGKYDGTAGQYVRERGNGTFAPVNLKPGQNIGRNIFSMTTATQPGYSPDFYNKIKQSFIDYSMPQYQTQLGQTQRNLVGNLASRGLLGSSVDQQASDALSQQATLAKQQISDQGQEYADQTKKQMTEQEANLKNQILVSSDPAAASAGALQTASTFSTPPSFTPLAGLFNQFANTYLINQASQVPASAYMPYGYGTTTGTNASYIPKNS